MFHSIIFAASFLHVIVSAFPGPAPTEYGNIDFEMMGRLGMSPAPTPAPRRRDAPRLFGRQASEGPQTCGYDDEDWYDPVTCEAAGRTCFFNTDSAWFGCCADSGCETERMTVCVPSTSAAGPSSSGTRYWSENMFHFHSRELFGYCPRSLAD
ncbi:hypothetical protein P154DRAFT_175111 [Amniculicola lignicola CBS 123094]|uniref:Uncharacterized protein n=1 Tax=Amniculicola lignicola CBS 123094 TaxID=1392246 RepID=A0A6A5WQ82_9PLEO|nr:hypothetical protein P154DRAFT_175111 [Amniculicola lignicola CBS 123094]